MHPLNESKIEDILKLNSEGYLFHREKSDLEYKENFNFAGLEEYLRDFAAFANNRGGYLVFGIKNAPREPIGMSEKSKTQFQQIDQEVISGHINELFSPAIEWEQMEIEKHGVIFGLFYVYEATIKPVIAKRDEGKGQTIKNGEVYYRYAGRTQKIEYAELEQIINNRIKQTNDEWKSLVTKIGNIGPNNAAVLDTEKGVVEKNEQSVLVIDKDLLDQIKFIREGEFTEKNGATALKVFGNVRPVDQVEVTKILNRDLNDLYPYTWTELVTNIQSNIENVGRNKISELIKEYDIKNNRRYSAYRFLNKQQQEQYEKDRVLPSVPSIYNANAIEFLTSKLLDAAS